jgi:thiol-disulfide isomerase/thioredoxin/outer membrane lipoprotein-sorting protein
MAQWVKKSSFTPMAIFRIISPPWRSPGGTSPPRRDIDPRVESMILVPACPLSRQGSHWMIFALAALLIAAGCQEQHDSQPQATIEPQSPRQMLEQMADAYRTARSYQDAGELHIVADGAAAEEPRPFAVALERPNKARIHSLGAIVVADGKKFYAVAPSLDEQILVRACNESFSIADFITDELLHQAMCGQLDAALPQLTLLLDPFGLETLTGDGTLEQLPDAEFQGETCRRVAATSPAGTAVFWISPASHLLRKYEFPMNAIRQRFPLSSVWVDFKGARRDGAISSLAFQMEIPPTSKLVKRFVLPAPEAPTSLLAQAAGEFAFTDLNGAQVSRESLAGKVVVLDMWATWCGWCFEGLPLLEQVHARYKDDDRVAILAVCKDEVAVSDERVRATFQQHKLTLPIVRDLRQISDAVFQVRALPTSVLLGPDGTVQDYHVGYDPQLAETLPQKIEKLLSGENLAQQELDAYREQQEDYQQRLSEALAETDSQDDAAEVARNPVDSK